MLLHIEDLTMPGKTPTFYPRGGGYSSVKEMQEELIHRRGNHWLHSDPRYCNFEVCDKIPDGLIIWGFSDAKGHWVERQRVTLEEIQ